MKNIYIFAAFLYLGGCASLPQAPKEKESLTIRNGLPAQNLAKGECGLFVWTADAERQFILFSRSDIRAGQWYSNGENIPLSITQQDGRSAEDQFPQTSFMTPDGTQLKIDLQKRQPINEGTRFKAGVLKVMAPNEWERIIPVVGLSACQTVNPADSQGS